MEGLSQIFARFSKWVLGVILAAILPALVPDAARAVPICVDNDLCIEIPTHSDYGYEVRSGDFNGDGRTDLYVTGGYMRVVPDFLILQNAPSPTGAITFSLASPNSTQIAQGRVAPVTSVATYRVELSGDGLFDFEFENVDEAIPGAPDIIVLTSQSNDPGFQGH